MNGLDLGLIGLFLISLVYGYTRGFVKQAIGFMGLAASFIVAYSFSQETAVYLQQQFPLPESSHPLFQAMLGMASVQQLVYSLLAFILLFFLVRIICRILGKIFESFAELPFISWFNRGLGAAFGLLQALVVVSIAAYLVQVSPDGSWKKPFYDSSVTRLILELSPFIAEQIERIPPKPVDLPAEPVDIL